MDALAAASLALFDDPNLGRSASYTPAGGGAAVALRVYLGRPQDTFAGDPGGRGAATLAHLSAAALAAVGLGRPIKGATLEVGGTLYKVAGVDLDPAGANYALVLQR